MNELDFWEGVYIASIQGTRSNGSVNGSFDSVLVSGRAENDADEAVQALRCRIRNGSLKLHE